MKKQNKRILHLLPTNNFSGAENVVCTIMENNNKYDMFYCCPVGPIEKILKEKNIKYIPLKKFNISEVKRVIRENKIDVIHAHDFKASFIANFVNFKGKIISHLHNNPPFIRKWNIFTIAYSLAAKKFYKVAVVSDAVYDEAVFNRKIKDKYVVVGNVVDCDRILKSSFDKYNEYYDIGFIGRITDQKDPISFIKIISKIKESIPNVKAVMIGSGDLEDECKKLIELDDLSNNIKMVGFDKNPYKILKNCKIVLMPSKYEGFGLTAIESMCLGKPLLNSGNGGLKGIFKDYKDFICSSIKEYVELSILLLTNEKKYKHYSKQCSIIIKPYIEIEKWMNKIYSLYE